jgi:hypothetical protein
MHQMTVRLRHARAAQGEHGARDKTTSEGTMQAHEAIDYDHGRSVMARRADGYDSHGLDGQTEDPLAALREDPHA